MGSDGQRAEAAAGRVGRLAPGTVVGRYVVLGQAGGPALFAAYDPELDRRVVLRFLADSTIDRELKIRGAKALASLSHPNVIHVHDVGTHGDHVFLAVEYVEGITLRRWLDRERHPWREVRELFLQVGRGLAALHAADLVAGAIEPVDTMIGDDGRVLLGHPKGPSASCSAPELQDGRAADALSDQYGYCALAYEALHGEPPAVTLSISTTASHAVARSDPSASMSMRRLVLPPSWFRRILRRGLSVDPAHRYPSMRELVRALARDPDVARKRWWALGAVVLMAGLGVLGYRELERQHSLTCKGADRKLEGVWDGEVGDRMQRAFATTDLPFADDAYESVARALDRYTQAWAGMHREACEATRVRKEQPEDVLDQRMRCLQNRLHEVSALTRVLADPDATVVRQAVRATHQLTRLDRCADAASSSREGTGRSQREDVEAVRARLAESNALNHAGKFKAAAELGRAVVDEARVLGDPQLLAEALVRQGHNYTDSGEPEGAEQALREAVRVAWSVGADDLAAEAWTGLVYVLGDDLARYEEANRHAGHAAAAVERLGGDDALQATLLSSLGVLRFDQGHYDDAISHYRRVLELRERLFGQRHHTLASIYNNLGNALNAQARHQEALIHYASAREIWEDALGPDHPDVAAVHNNIAAVHYSRGDFPAACDSLRHAHRIRKRSLDPIHPEIAKSLNNLGTCSYQLGHHDEALSYMHESLRVSEALGDLEHPDVATTLLNMGAALHDAGREDEAYEHQMRALAIVERTLGDAHPYEAMILNNLAQLHQDHGELEQALAILARSLQIQEHNFGSDHPTVAGVLTSIGDVRQEMDPRSAIEPLERALAILSESPPGNPAESARTRFALARALWSANSDRERATRLANQAREGFAAAQPVPEDRVSSVESWLKDRQ